MGFPAACSKMPRLLLNLLFLLAHLRCLSYWLLRLVSADIDDDLSFDYSDTSDFADHHLHPQPHQEQKYQHDHDLQLTEHSPVECFHALCSAEDNNLLLLEGCAVCLGEFHDAAWVRRPRGYRHVFHRGCLDRFVAHDHHTCPLCRAPLLPMPVLLPLLLPAS